MAKKVLLIMGDSLVEGVGDKYGGGWAGRLKKITKKDFKIFIRGIGGQNIFDLYRSVELELKKYQPNVVIIQIGVNDSRIRDSLGGKNEVPLEDFTQTYSKIISSLKNYPSVEFFAAVGLPRVDESLTYPYKPDKHYINEEIDKFESAIREICYRYGVAFIGIGHRVNPENRPSMLFDGIHPSSAGHQAIVEEVHNVFQNYVPNL
jgi:lysophospholipase L1-like esterase